MLRLILCCIALLPVFAQTAQGAPDTHNYSIFPLLDGSRPEGVTAGSSNDLWVACLSGKLLHVDLANNKTTLVYSEAGVALSGAKFCTQQQVLFAAGSLSGKGFIYHMHRDNSSNTGQQDYTVTKRQVVELYNKPGLAYINDVALSQDKVYFTDSFHPVIYSIERDQGAPSSNGRVQQHNTGRYFDTKLGQFRANGLAVQSSSKCNDTLLLANTHTGNLYRVVVGKVAHAVVEVQQQHPEHQEQQVHAAPRALGALPAEKGSLSLFGLGLVHEGKPVLTDQTAATHQTAVVQELVLPKVPGKVSDTLLLDGVWFVNSTFALVADNYNNRVWGIKVAADLTKGEIACLIQLPVFGVPTTITSLAGRLYVVNAHLDTCFPFFPCPLHKFEIIGTDAYQCQPWP